MCFGQVALWASSNNCTNCFSFSPTAISLNSMSGVLNMHEECDAACSRYLGMAMIIPNRLWHNDPAMMRSMIRLICNSKIKGEVSSGSLLSNLGIQDMVVVLCT